MDGLRYDDDITGLELYVLGKIAALHALSVMKRNHVLRRTHAAQHDNVIESGERGHAACDGERLQNVHAWVHHERARLADLTDHIDSVAVEFLHRRGDNRLRNI